MQRPPRRALPAAPLAALGALALAALVVLALAFGPSGAVGGLADAWRGLSGALGLGEPLEGWRQTVVELRLWRALTAAGVGAALGVSGALVQGVFRNPLASPGILGLSGGASLGAVLAVVAAGGYGLGLTLDEARGSGPWLVPAAAFAGALATSLAVWRLASYGGRVSVPALLLLGIAVNTLLAGVQQLVHSLVLEDVYASRAIVAWSFGTLDDRAAWHALVAGSGAALALAVAPFVAWELDLLQAGTEDAEALGVNVRAVQVLALSAASLAAAAAVSVAGQIGFVGLIVPHLVRFVAGGGHRALLPLSALAGALVLLGADLAQAALFSGLGLQPGVVMALVGGPFFVWLLWRARREIAVW
jgi:iron complex transport system permease protein